MVNKHNSVTAMDIFQIVLIVLKLCKVIDWSWWWVLSPMWISASILIVAMIIAAVHKAVKQKRRLKEYDEYDMPDIEKRD